MKFIDSIGYSLVVALFFWYCYEIKAIYVRVRASEYIKRLAISIMENMVILKKLDNHELYRSEIIADEEFKKNIDNLSKINHPLRYYEIVDELMYEDLKFVPYIKKEEYSPEDISLIYQQIGGFLEENGSELLNVKKSEATRMSLIQKVASFEEGLKSIIGKLHRRGDMIPEGLSDLASLLATIRQGLSDSKIKTDRITIIMKSIFVTLFLIPIILPFLAEWILYYSSNFLDSILYFSNGKYLSNINHNYFTYVYMVVMIFFAVSIVGSYKSLYYLPYYQDKIVIKNDNKFWYQDMPISIAIIILFIVIPNIAIVSEFASVRIQIDQPFNSLLEHIFLIFRHLTESVYILSMILYLTLVISVFYIGFYKRFGDYFEMVVIVIDRVILICVPLFMFVYEQTYENIYKWTEKYRGLRVEEIIGVIQNIPQIEFVDLADLASEQSLLVAYYYLPLLILSVVSIHVTKYAYLRILKYLEECEDEVKEYLLKTNAEVEILEGEAETQEATADSESPNGAAR